MIEIILALLIGIWIGRTVTNALNQMVFKQILEDLGITQEQMERLRDKVNAGPAFDDEDDSIVEIKLEQHQGQIYAFRKDTDQFLGQGTDRDSLINRLRQEFTEGQEIKLIIREEDGADLIKS
jgi:hypothetical protein